MKKIYSTTALIVCLLAGLYGQSPSAYYSFNNETITDSGPAKLHLEAVVAPIFSADRVGQDGQAISLTDNGLSYPFPDQLNMTGQITVAGWIKQNATSGEWKAIINKWEASSGSYYLGINPANNSMRWNCFVGNIEDPTRMPTNEWVHYVATYDGQRIKLYRNGALVNSMEVEESYAETAVEFRLGYQSNGDASELYFNGDLDEVYMFNVALTDTEVADLYNGTLTADDEDLVLYDLNMDSKQLASEKLKVSGIVSNNSNQSIQGFDLEIEVGNEVENFSFSNESIEPNGTFSFDLETDFDLEIGTAAEVKVTVVKAGDVDLDNNTRTESVTKMSFFPTRKVVIEEGTGTWCGFCPRGAVTLDNLTENYPDNFIGIAIHNGDPMTNDVYDTGAAFDGYPLCHVDRSLIGVDISPLAGESYMALRSNSRNIPEAAISHETEYSPFQRRLFVTTTVDPAIPLSGLYTYGLVITEDGVTSDDPAYAQVNFYSGGALGPMAGYENLPSTVPASQMVYNHVAREILGGYNGVPASLIRTLELGEQYSYTHVYDVPDEFDVENIHVVSLFIDNLTGRIVNAESTGLLEGGITSTRDEAAYDKLVLYPNPAQEMLSIDIDLKSSSSINVAIQNINGQNVYQKDFGILSGYVSKRITLDNWAPGIYIVGIELDGQLISKKLVIN